MTGTLSDRSAG